MLNFLHKPCCADGEKAEIISEKLKNKFNNIKENELEYLLSTVRLGTKKVPSIRLDEINDFPRLTETMLQEDLFFGSYYIRQAKSYLADIIKYDVCSIIDENILNSLKIERRIRDLLVERLKTTKLIAMEITSRHRRGTKKDEYEEKEDTVKKYRVTYKVFIEYIQNNDQPDSIKSN